MPILNETRDPYIQLDTAFREVEWLFCTGYSKWSVDIQCSPEYFKARVLPLCKDQKWHVSGKKHFGSHITATVWYNEYIWGKPEWVTGDMATWKYPRYVFPGPPKWSFEEGDEK